ncbi:class I SAM-dependent methyltransferase [Thiolapillus sp.]|uniref:class I SAM-dependent methyltransferase n=1 Tax=Thiolapillus sp. TaxID=2017437 RepID=UPI0025CE55F5|nr:class I SAM-dependent methyltransferase [Thiolapillus sp.]
MRDYRELTGKAHYDRINRIISVGMFEHIGIKNFPRYFHTISQLLKPDGLFLNHGIASDTDWKQTTGTRFINNYIFPDGELARISTVLKAMEDAGFETLDVENLRPHYGLTLRHWIHNLEIAKHDAIRTTSKATYRLWRLYMAACAYHFNSGSNAVYQILAGLRGNPKPTPLRRSDLYTGTEARTIRNSEKNWGTQQT